jgi:hypothetical protein
MVSIAQQRSSSTEDEALVQAMPTRAPSEDRHLRPPRAGAGQPGVGPARARGETAPVVVVRLAADELVRQYLVRLHAAALSMAPARRAWLLSGVAQRIDDARRRLPAQTVPAVRNILDVLGTPDDLVCRATVGTRPEIEASRRRVVVQIALMMIGMGLIGCLAALVLTLA